ncbi:MAG: polysaccharide deacetylase family protein [Paludibacteraceae bacterium]|nr:polysaccharide deacetylase family protein [Paludibacteraceae bacterium]
MKLFNKIKRKWAKLRLAPIRVFCLHHVCEHFDAESMFKGDWMLLDEFKQKVLAMQQSGIEFISLSNAHRIISKQQSAISIRLKRYAVLTFDDGYASLKEVLPWLHKQQIPGTLFINGKYLDGVSYRENPNEIYLTKQDLEKIAQEYPLITIGHHGWEHTDAWKMDEEDSIDTVERNVAALSCFPNNVPFWAFTWGHYGKFIHRELRKRNIIPVYVDSAANYNDVCCIHRELLDT